MLRLGLALSLAFASLAHAGQPLPEPRPVPAATEEWSVNFTPFLWAQSVRGTIGARGARTDIDVPFSDLIRNFDFGYNLALEIRQARWGFLLDANYANVSTSGSTPFGLAFTKVDVRLKQFIGHAAVAYRLVQQPAFALDVFAGVRVNHLENSIRLQGNQFVFDRLGVILGINDRNLTASKGWVDPIVGVRAQMQLSPKVSLRVFGDLGGFGAGSDVSAQITGTVHVQVSPRWSVFTGYRAIYTDYTSGSFTYDVTAHGPVIGSSFRF